MQTGALTTSQAMKQLHKPMANIPLHDIPKCVGSQFGKQTNRPVPGRGTRSVGEQAGILSAEKLQPGQRIFIDHFQCSTLRQKFKGQGI